MEILHDCFVWRDCMSFLSRGCVILCVDRLCDFCVWRGCAIFLTHSLREAISLKKRSKYRHCPEGQNNYCHIGR